MAKLFSEESNCPSCLEILFAENRKLPSYDTGTQDWQLLKIELSSGSRMVSTAENEDTLICRSPSDEMAMLVSQLKELLDHEHKREEVRFEPSEPSFELTFSRTRANGIKVEAWIDAGNGTTGIYTWDAAGIRFLTTEQKVTAFIHALEEEFKLA